MTVATVLVARLAAWGFGLGLGRVFGEGSGLAFAGTLGGFELLTEIVTGALQSGDEAFELGNPRPELLVLGPQGIVRGSGHTEPPPRRHTRSCE